MVSPSNQRSLANASKGKRLRYYVVRKPQQKGFLSLKWPENSYLLINGWLWNIKFIHSDEIIISPLYFVHYE
jgi:hypothetical protein